MNKKLLTVAVSAALAGAMGVANADVKINGTINASLDSIKGNPATTPAATDNKNKTNVSSNASNVVLSATQDLGGGLSGVFSWQEFVRLDTNNRPDTKTGALAGGNTFLGLKGDAWGMVALGTQDSGAKLNGRAFDLFGNQIGDTRNGGTFGTTTGAGGMSNNRVDNMVFYTSPNFAGLNVMVGHSTNFNSTTATVEASDTLNTAQLKYSMSSLLVGVGYDKISLGTTTTGKDGEKWLNAGVKYGLPSGTDLIVAYQKDDNVGNTAGAESKIYGFGVAQKFGDNTVKAQYYMGKAKLNSAATECKPKLFAVGLDHAFSKAYTGYIAYAQAKQDNNSGCSTDLSMAGGGHGDNPGSVAGKTMSGLSVGAIMKF